MATKNDMCEDWQCEDWHTKKSLTCIGYRSYITNIKGKSYIISRLGYKGCWVILLSAHCFGLNIFYLHTLYIEQHIKTNNNIQYTNEIQKKVFYEYTNLYPI